MLRNIERALALLAMAAVLLLFGAIDCGEVPPPDIYTPAEVTAW